MLSIFLFHAFLGRRLTFAYFLPAILSLHRLHVLLDLGLVTQLLRLPLILWFCLGALNLSFGRYLLICCRPHVQKLLHLVLKLGLFIICLWFFFQVQWVKKREMRLFMGWSFSIAVRVHINFEIIIFSCFFCVPRETQPLRLLNIGYSQHSTLLFVDCHNGRAIKYTKLLIRLQISDHITRFEAFWYVAYNDSTVVFISTNVLDWPIIISET